MSRIVNFLPSNSVPHPVSSQTPKNTASPVQAIPFEEGLRPVSWGDYVRPVSDVVIDTVSSALNPAILLQHPSNFVPAWFPDKYENPQGLVEHAYNFNHDANGYLQYGLAAVSLASNWATLGSAGVSAFRPTPKPVQTNPQNPYRNPTEFSSHKPIIRDFIEGVTDSLPHTTRPPIHSTSKPYQPTSPNRVPNGNRWHNPGINPPNRGLVRKMLEGFPNKLPVMKRFPFHDVGKPYNPSSNLKLPPPPC